MDDQDKDSYEEFIKKNYPQDKSKTSSFLFWLVLGLFVAAALLELTGNEDIIWRNAGWIGIIFGFSGCYWLIQDYRNGLMKSVPKRGRNIIKRGERPVLFYFIFFFYLLCFLILTGIGVYGVF